MTDAGECVVGVEESQMIAFLSSEFSTLDLAQSSGTSFPYHEDILETSSILVSDRHERHQERDLPEPKSLLQC